MSNKVYKKVEIVGSSETSQSDAIRNAVEKAQQTLRNIDWFEVIESRGAIFEGKITYQVTVKVGFRLE